jgi:hypothetical protein
VNQALGLRQIGLDALWKLYYAPNHGIVPANVEKGGAALLALSR